MNEIEKMRSGLLADFSAPEVQDSFRHCKKLLAKFRTMSTYDDDYRTVLEDLIPGIPETSVIMPPFHCDHGHDQQQGKLFCLLCGPGVCRMSVRIQTALVADADAATVPGTAVCPHFQQFAVLGDGAVATDIEVVTYSPETTGLMVTK